LFLLASSLGGSFEDRFLDAGVGAADVCERYLKGDLLEPTGLEAMAAEFVKNDQLPGDAGVIADLWNESPFDALREGETLADSEVYEGDGLAVDEEEGDEEEGEEDEEEEAECDCSECEGEEGEDEEGEDEDEEDQTPKIQTIQGLMDMDIHIDVHMPVWKACAISVAVLSYVWLVAAITSGGGC
jgi:hypothetical protein